MAPFPTVKTAKPDVIAHQPSSARSQVHICAAHQADVFDAIPYISVGHADLHHWRWYGDFQ
jgi:hypothetical protein